METVEVVIKLPKKKYDVLMETGDCSLNHNERAIKHGTVLPKGHGRLVDADAITNVEIFKQSFVINYDQLTGKSSIACTVPSVIEADKEVDT